MKTRLRFLLLTLMILAPLPAYGQLVVASSPSESPSPENAESLSPENSVETVKLVLHPAGEPSPALKYQLLPPFIERRPGNAAVLYGKAAALMNSYAEGHDQEVSAWLDLPPKDYPEEVIRGVNGLRACFQMLDKAARSEYVDWQLPLHDESPFEILLPELKQQRKYARMLVLRTRIHQAAGEYDEAIRSLQSGYALGRHAGQGKTLVSGLVGIAIINIMSSQVESLIQQPDAPNLYWALTQLPDPLIDIHESLEAESAFLFLWFPELQDVEHKDLSAAQCREMLRKLIENTLSLTDSPPSTNESVLASTALVLRGYPMAKRGLIEWGYDPAEVEAMPVAKVVLIYTVRQYEVLRDDLFKWMFVPYWENREGIAQANTGLEAAKLQHEVVPLATVLLPAISAVQRSDARARRTIAALRVIEAIRLHGAANDGNLPKTLDDIAEVPVPRDPTTGEPFGYELTGRTAVLQSPGGQFGLRYEITFAEKGN